MHNIIVAYNYGGEWWELSDLSVYTFRIPKIHLQHGQNDDEERPDHNVSEAGTNHVRYNSTCILLAEHLHVIFLIS